MNFIGLFIQANKGNALCALNVYCVFYSYKDYRSDEDQSLTSQFWLILALRFAFVILFEVQILQLFNLTLFYCMYLLTLALLCSFLVKHCLRSSVLLSLLSM